ncbi:MAG: TetR/AcrR family transcriptional regulator [Myxococcota bacterium]|nr:TetR/AcrR family transcriptional regulator [Myxococcota bacterium]
MPLREEKKAESRRRILESAREVFFRDGFMQANLDEVAERAGVAKGTLYRYFESKAELYVAVLAHNGAIFEQKMRESVHLEVPAPEQMRGTARFYFNHYVENREYFQIFWAIENQAVIGELPSGVVDEVARLWERCLAILAEIIERGVKDGSFAPCDSWQMANLLWTMANALIQTETSSTRRKLRRVPLAETYEDAIEVFVRGLGAGSGASRLA